MSDKQFQSGYEAGFAAGFKQAASASPSSTLSQKELMMLISSLAEEIKKIKADVRQEKKKLSGVELDVEAIKQMVGRRLS